MVRFSFLVIAFGLQHVAGQFCGVQSSCSSCLSVNGCVWNVNVCLSSSTIFDCSTTPNCISTIGQCSVIVAPLLPASPPLYTGTVLPPVSTAITGTVLPPVISTSPPLYASTSVGLAPPVYSPPLYSSVGTTLAAPIAPIYAPAAPIYSAPMYPAAPMYNAPYGGFYAGGGFSAGGGGFYGGGFDNDNGGFFNGPLFDTNGNPVRNTIRNDFFANAISPFVPGIGGAVSLANNVNLVSNAPDFVNNVVGGNGYRRNPVGSFVRNGFYANALGGIIPGLSGPLNAFNKIDLAASLLG